MRPSCCRHEQQQRSPASSPPISMLLMTASKSSHSHVDGREAGERCCAFKRFQVRSHRSGAARQSLTAPCSAVGLPRDHDRAVRLRHRANRIQPPVTQTGARVHKDRLQCKYKIGYTTLHSFNAINCNSCAGSAAPAPPPGSAAPTAPTAEESLGAAPTPTTHEAKGPPSARNSARAVA